jgi:peptidyl-prolyl cis-trans isomerase D
MFDGIRKHQKLLQFALLLLILPAFVFFGVSGYTPDSKEITVAKVGDAVVSEREFNQALERQLDQIRQMTGGQSDIKQFDTPEARKVLLENLISRKVMEQHASQAHLVASRKAVFDALNQIPSLKNPDGTFNQEQYKNVLRAQGQSPEAFEAQFAKDLTAGAMVEALTASAFGSSAVADNIAALTEQVRVVKTLPFKSIDFAAKIVPTDEQIKSYFDKNQAQFKTEESAKIEYLVLNADALASQVKLDPDAVKTYYEQNKQRFGAKEQRRASHIFFEAAKSASDSVKKTAREGAAAALAQVLKDPSQFAQIAKSKSQDAGSADKGGDLGFFTKDGLVQAVADAAWALKDGEISPQVVESEDGYHVVKLTGIQPGDAKPFEAVKAEIEADLKRQQASRLFSESAEGFTNTVYEQADSLKSAADKYKLVIQTAQGVSRNAPQPGSGPVLSNPKLLKAIFSDDSLQKKRNTEAVEVSTGTLVSARVLEYLPAAVKPLDQVKAVVIQKLQAEEGKKQATAQGEAKLKEIIAGGAASAVFTEPALTVSRMNPTTLDRPTMEAVFRASDAKLPSFVGVSTDTGYVIVQLLEVKKGEGKEVDGRRAQLQGQVDGIVQRQEFTAFTDNLKSRFKVSRQEGAILKKEK